MHGIELAGVQATATASAAAATVVLKTSHGSSDPLSIDLLALQKNERGSPFLSVPHNGLSEEPNMTSQLLMLLHTYYEARI